MFVFYFHTFLGQLDIQAPTNNKIPKDSAILFFFVQKDDITKHEILRRFNNILKSAQIDWIRPFKELTKEWVIDLKAIRNSFEILRDTEYLKGKLTVEPDYYQNEKIDDSGEIESIESIIKFAIYPEDIPFLQTDSEFEISAELTKPLDRFNKDFSKPQKCGFLMMKFEDSPIQSEIVNTLKKHFQGNGFALLRADDKWYSDDLLTNIKTYMHGCAFGVALFERINTNYFNPNVSLEIGYMMALRKPILYLKDKTLVSLHSDLIGKLYAEFDFQNIKSTLPNVIDKWLKDYEMI